MFERRDVLKAALGAIRRASFRRRQARGRRHAAAPTVRKSAPFSRDMVVERARALAAKPLYAAANDLREPFANLTYEQYVRDIKTKPDAAIWRQRQYGFHHRAAAPRLDFHGAGGMYVVEDGEPQRDSPTSRAAIRLWRAQDRRRHCPTWDFPAFACSAPKMAARSGDDRAVSRARAFIRARVAPGSAARRDRARALHSHRRSARRGIPGLPRLLDREAGARRQRLVIHALLDSPSVAGVYRFTLRPGEATIIDTELTLFPRVDRRSFRNRRTCRRLAVHAARPPPLDDIAARRSPTSTACRC